MAWSERSVRLRDLLDYSEELMRAFLQDVPAGKYRAEDYLDGDGISDRAIKIAVSDQRFTGTDKRRQGAVATAGEDAGATGGRGVRATWSRLILRAAIRRLREA